ncbi:nuclease-related domain-containing protein [Sporosarcina ureilytica]|uniref:NERD domain-containing protein n=1 Tax=Sporosarcina ureilytica TaxID=298596 RepID=A0A1D8JJ86_9BACL|nr:nuclease-related domain-containing protein [Sporosarcina ureilytica]AOV08773.1 hypothetical protein BI350_15290 [Sporosarcina ureilytica]
MVQLHSDRHTLRKKANQYLLLSIIFWTPPILYMVLFFLRIFHFQNALHLAPMLFAGAGIIFWRKYAILRVGLQGETKVANVLEKLPAGYKSYNSVRIAADDGQAEMDYIIVGRNGVFVVEVKNHNGTIVGKGADRVWIQHKVGRKGGQYSNEMRNPMKQVGRQVYFLSNYLKANDLDVWIEGIVFFSNDRVKVKVETEKGHVFTTSDELLNFITTYVSRNQIRDSDLTKLNKLLKMQ